MKRNIIITVLALFLTTGLYAQDLFVGPFLGYQKPQDADEGSLLGGAGVRLHLSDALAVEGTIMYRSEEYGAATVTSWPIMVTGMFYPLPIAYGLIGAGWYNTTFEYNNEFVGMNIDTKETTQEFGWHFGGGIELPLGESLNLTGDIRYVFIDYDFEEVPGSDDIDSDFFMVNVGLLFEL